MKHLIIGFVTAFVIVGISVMALLTNKGSATSDTTRVLTEIPEGAQVAEITARGGYFPSQIVLDADVPTVLRVSTNNTFDCSLALRIPKLKYSEFLPSNGVTEIIIPAQSAGTTIEGLCSMAMYRFALKFE